MEAVFSLSSDLKKSVRKSSRKLKLNIDSSLSESNLFSSHCAVEQSHKHRRQNNGSNRLLPHKSTPNLDRLGSRRSLSGFERSRSSSNFRHSLSSRKLPIPCHQPRRFHSTRSDCRQRSFMKGAYFNESAKHPSIRGKLSEPFGYGSHHLECGNSFGDISFCHKIYRRSTSYDKDRRAQEKLNLSAEKLSEFLSSGICNNGFDGTPTKNNAKKLCSKFSSEEEIPNIFTNPYYHSCNSKLEYHYVPPSPASIKRKYGCEGINDTKLRKVSTKSLNYVMSSFPFSGHGDISSKQKLNYSTGRDSKEWSLLSLKNLLPSIDSFSADNDHVVSINNANVHSVNGIKEQPTSERKSYFFLSDPADEVDNCSSLQNKDIHKCDVVYGDNFFEAEEDLPSEASFGIEVVSLLDPRNDCQSLEYHVSATQTVSKKSKAIFQRIEKVITNKTSVTQPKSRLLSVGKAFTSMGSKISKYGGAFVTGACRSDTSIILKRAVENVQGLVSTEIGLSKPQYENLQTNNEATLRNISANFGKSKNNSAIIESKTNEYHNERTGHEIKIGNVDIKTNVTDAKESNPSEIDLKFKAGSLIKTDPIDHDIDIEKGINSLSIDENGDKFKDIEKSSIAKKLKLTTKPNFECIPNEKRSLLQIDEHDNFKLVHNDGSVTGVVRVGDTSKREPKSTSSDVSLEIISKITNSLSLSSSTNSIKANSVEKTSEICNSLQTNEDCPGESNGLSIQEEEVTIVHTLDKLTMRSNNCVEKSDENTTEFQAIIMGEIGINDESDDTFFEEINELCSRITLTSEELLSTNYLKAYGSNYFTDVHKRDNFLHW